MLIPREPKKHVALQLNKIGAYGGQVIDGVLAEISLNSHWFPDLWDEGCYGWKC